MEGPKKTKKKRKVKDKPKRTNPYSRKANQRSLPRARKTTMKQKITTRSKRRERMRFRSRKRDKKKAVFEQRRREKSFALFWVLWFYTE